MVEIRSHIMKKNVWRFNFLLLETWQNTFTEERKLKSQRAFRRIVLLTQVLYKTPKPL